MLPLNINKLTSMTIALAGMAQVTGLIQALTRTGKLDEIAWHASVNSLFQTDPSDTYAVYGGRSGIAYGLKNLVTLFSPPIATHELQCILNIMRIQRKIWRSSTLKNQLAKRIRHAQKQAHWFGDLHHNVIMSLADIYESTLNTLHFRTTIIGSHQALATGVQIEKVQTLLLAGVRSAVLWQQLGGSRLMLALLRKQLHQTATELLQHPHIIMRSALHES